MTDRDTAEPRERFRAGRFDFHLHTDRSDGHLPPERLWEILRERGMTGVSITDHDTVDAYDRLPEARLVGRPSEPRPHPDGSAIEPWLLPGVEFSTSTDGEELHVLGYFPRGFPAAFREFVETVLGDRERRMARGIRELRERGIDISLRDCRVAAAGRVLSRTHVAEALRRKRYVREARQAYRRFLGPGAFPCSASGTAAVISTIRELGGLAVWAHPREEQTRRHLAAFARAGLQGVEVYTPWRQRRERARLLRAASEAGLFATAGSDWHGQPGNSRSSGFSADENVVGDFLDRVTECLR